MEEESGWTYACKGSSTSSSGDAESGIGQGSNLQCQELVCKRSQQLWVDEVVLHEAAAQNIAVLRINETRRPGWTVSTAAGYRVLYSGSVQGERQGVALAAKESTYKTSTFTREEVDERLVSIRFEILGQHQAVNLVVGYAPTEPSDSEKKRAF